HGGHGGEAERTRVVLPTRTSTTCLVSRPAASTRTSWYPGAATLATNGPEPATVPSTRTVARAGAVISSRPYPAGTSAPGGRSSSVRVAGEGAAVALGGVCAGALDADGSGAGVAAGACDSWRTHRRTAPSAHASNRARGTHPPRRPSGTIEGETDGRI